MDNRITLAEYSPGRIGLVKQAVLVPGDRGQLRTDAQMEGAYFRGMAAALKGRLSQVILLLPGDDGFPEYADAWATRKPAGVISGIADQARSNGINALISTSVADMRVHKKKSGFWFWRKIKYVLTVSATLDILDPFTSARVASVIKDAKTNTDLAAYNAAQNAQWYNIIAAQTLLDKLAVEIAEEAVDVLDQLPWQAAVTRVDNDRVTLAGSRIHGLKAGDHLAVFEGRSIVKGHNAQAYIAPGFKLAEIRITAVDENSAQAAVIDGGGVRVGDIAVAATVTAQ